MKPKVLSLFLWAWLCLFCANVSAQAPQGINFQALAKDGANAAVTNATVGIKMSILNGSPSGNVVYAETHTALTNEKGVFSLVIGQGTVLTGQFDTLKWGEASKWVQIEMDAAGGANYTLMSVQQLMSVPYALYAENSGLWQKGAANSAYYNAGNVGIGTVNPTQRLHINGKLRVGAYVLPETDGANGQVLTTDGAGNVTWQNAGATNGGSNATTLIYTLKGF